VQSFLTEASGRAERDAAMLLVEAIKRCTSELIHCQLCNRCAQYRY
jgi:hypothetical protein